MLHRQQLVSPPLASYTHTQPAQAGSAGLPPDCRHQPALLEAHTMWSKPCLHACGQPAGQPASQQAEVHTTAPNRVCTAPATVGGPRQRPWERGSPTGLQPASKHRSTAASVWPGRTRTPPGRARKGKMCPGLFSPSGRVAGSDSARIVLHRSLADTPVLVVSLQRRART